MKLVSFSNVYLPFPIKQKPLTFKGEKCHGGKHNKERLTVLLAANMDGSEKFKPLVIGNAMKPRCFKGVKSCPTTYRFNKKSLNDYRTF